MKTKEELKKYRNEKYKKYAESHKDKIIEIKKRYYEKNRTKCLNDSLNYYYLHQEYKKEYGREYYKKNKEKCLEYMNNRYYNKIKKDIKILNEKEKI